jgi:hypothetical protein
VPEICHRVGIAAPRHRRYEEFATKAGLVEFWTPVEKQVPILLDEEVKLAPRLAVRRPLPMTAHLRIWAEDGRK